MHMGRFCASLNNEYKKLLAKLFGIDRSYSKSCYVMDLSTSCTCKFFELYCQEKSKLEMHFRVGDLAKFRNILTV